MPGIGGVEAARQIREGGGPNDVTPIIAFTAGEPSLGAHVNADRIFDATLQKPVGMGPLLEALTLWSQPELPAPQKAAAHV
jgi:CheY-like chemotaxis protein